MKKLAVFVIVLVAFASGCSVRYTERVPGFQPGYVDVPLGEGTYQVKIGEAWPKDWPNLEKFALYRAADITKGHGKIYFAVLSASTEISGYTMITPTTTQTSISAIKIGNSLHGQATSMTHGGNPVTIQGGWYFLDFKVLNSPDTGNYDRVFNADSVMKDLQ